MRAFVTGGTGFIGHATVAALRARGDQVAALARSAPKARSLVDLGAEVTEGDLSSRDALCAAMSGCDAVLHIAGSYKVGIPASERPAMYAANVTGTETTLDAAADAAVATIIYVSTVNVFGNTHGKVVDETYERDHADGFVSYYDRTKYLAHGVAEDRIRAGAPIVVTMPGGVYGPGDHSEIGVALDQLRAGKLRAKTFPELGMTFVHVDDVAAGILLALDHGRTGQSYVLGGQITTLGAVIDDAASVLGRKPPRVTLPAWTIRAALPFAPIVTKAMGQPPNLRELITAAHGVTYWATDAKARSELGYAPRDAVTGLRETFAA